MKQINMWLPIQSIDEIEECMDKHDVWIENAWMIVYFPNVQKYISYGKTMLEPQYFTKRDVLGMINNTIKRIFPQERIFVYELESYTDWGFLCRFGHSSQSE